MGVESSIFQSGGQRTEHHVPGSYSRSQSIASASGGVSAGNGVILGKSTGGKPNTLLVFSSIAEAKEILVSGDLLDAVAHAFTPGGSLSPQQIFAMRVNTGTQSGLTVQSASSDIINLLSWDWGVHTNQLKFMLEDGTDAGTKKITTSWGGNENVTDNIYRQSLSLSYTGTGTAAILSVTADSISTTVSDVESDNFSIAFADFSTIGEIVTKIRDLPNYTVVLLDSDTRKSIELDAVSGVDIKTSEKTLTSNVQALIEAFNADSYIEFAELAQGASRVMPDNNTEFVYFSGGTEGSYTAVDWNNTLHELETEEIQIVSTPSTDMAVHVLIKNHCVAMSSVENRKERTFLLGGAIGQSIDDALQQSKILATRLGSYCYPSITTSNPLTGETVALDASYLACKLLGMEVSLAVNEPLTWKDVNVIALGTKLRNVEVVKLIKGGVLACGVSDDNRFVVMRAMTTFQGNTLQDCERSMVREDLYMNRDLRRRFSPGVGRPAKAGTATDLGIVNTAGQDWLKEGYIQGSIWGVKIAKDGDTTRISFNRYLTPPQNFFFITASNYVYNSSTSVAV